VDSGLASEEIGRRALHEFESFAVGVIEGEDDARVMFAR
jgi:hypothetical protein